MNQPNLESRRRRIFQVTENHSAGNTGVTAVVTQISRYLSRQGWPVTILAAGKAAGPVPPGVDLVEFPLRPAGNPWPRGAASLVP